MILPMIYLPIYVSGLGNGEAAAQASAQIIASNYSLTLILRALLALTSVGLLFYELGKNDEKNGLSFGRIGSVFVLILVSEFIGRYVFYASAVSIIVGMK